MVQGKHMQCGKRLNGSGGKIADFLYASASTGNLALIEIKSRGTELLNKIRTGDDVYALSKAGRSHCPSSGSALQAPKRTTRYKNNVRIATTSIVMRYVA